MAQTFKNKEEFKKFYLDNFGALVNYAYTKTKDMELSREIVQNVFVKLWNNRNNIDIKTSLKSYLYSMLRNNIIDHYRKEEKVTSMGDIPGTISHYIEETGMTEEDVYEFRYNLKKALATLKEKRRKIFELSKFEGLTYSEIADYLKISERTVEDNIAKALKEIRLFFINNNININVR